MFVQNVSEEKLNSRVQGVKRYVSPGEIVETTEEEGKFLTTVYSRQYVEVPKASEPKAAKTAENVAKAEKKSK